MIDVSPAFRQALSDDNRNYIERATITLKDDTVLNLTEENIWSGGFSLDDAVSQDTVFSVGNAIINKATIIINNIYGTYSQYDFTDATIVLGVGLVLDDPDNPEIITKGTYVEQETKYDGDLITIEMYDYMSKFDKAYTTTLPYPMRLIDILEDCCDTCGVTLATDTFPNSTIPISEKPTSVTHREIISWIAGIAGCFARCNADGELELKWFDTDLFESEDDPIDGMHYITEKYSGNVSVDDVVITCVKVIVISYDNQTIEYTAGTDGYAVKVENNKFITEDNAQAIKNYLGQKLIGIRFRIVELSHPSDPTIEAGDVALYTDRHDTTYNVLVTSTKFAVGSAQNTSCSAETPARNSADRYSEQTRNYVELRKVIADNKEYSDSMFAELEEQIENIDVSSIDVGGTNLLQSTQDYFYSDGYLEDSGCLYTQNCVLTGLYKGCVGAFYDNTESSSTADMLAWHNIQVELRTTYTLSFWARTDTDENPNMYVYFYGESGYPQVEKGVSSEDVQNTNTDGLMPFNLTNQWQRYWVKWKITDIGDIEKKKWVLFRAAALASVYVAGVKLEEGTVDTYYSPAPDDATRKIVASKYGICESSSDSMEKTVSLPNFALYDGVQFAVTFINGNEADGISMDVNGTGMKYVTSNSGEELNGKLNFPSGTTASFIYDGASYRFIASDNLYNMIRWTEETGLDIKAKEGSLSRVNINNRSVDVYDENGSLGTSTNKDGFDVYESGTKVAHFGERSVIGEEDNGARIEIGNAAIEFYEDDTRTAYVAEDKFYFINGEVTQALFFPDYSIREDINKNIIIYKR